ncbi:metallophosphoesterase family protein [Flammeovirgaceae bacterium SG7u.111]|nr:metallophosphoesterase family protein [Flammeovirgaceae bacterium SG7u.132]WPO34455.1 metallophosphoesterase family protein [Flammeovirgaceae bacterium SG7u.111]
MRIGLLSDTHGYMDEAILRYLAPCDEIWHAGDVGTLDVAKQLVATGKPVRMVFGNIDGQDLRVECPKNQLFDCEGKKVWMTHIGGYPPRYTTEIREQLDKIKPDIFICGHSHILKVIPDKKRGLLHINPGAAGIQGFHKVRTLIRFELNVGKISNMEVVELGARV